MSRRTIFVSGAVLAHNRRTGENAAPIRVEYLDTPGGETRYDMAHRVSILDAAGTVIAEVKHEAFAVWIAVDDCSLRVESSS